jgi:2-oxoglutarate dehydrogenase E2 component (dihydrolipoamide succinyltransferase)
MGIELKIPEVGESITEVEIGGWLKQPGDSVKKDEPLVTLESEKATVELPAPESGKMGQVLKQKGEVVKVGEVIGYLESAGSETAAPKPAVKKAEENQPKPEKPPAQSEKAPTPPATPPPAAKPQEQRIMPAAKRVIAEKGLNEADVKGTGPGGRVLKEDVQRLEPAPQPAQPSTDTMPPFLPEKPAPGGAAREEEAVPMSRLRRTVAERLVAAQHNAALLTTFNEIDMGSVMGLRKEFSAAFLAKHNVKLGFMSFFVKACIDALKQCPALNAEIRGGDIVYHNFFDIGVAIGSGKGLVVPVLRNAEHLSFAEIEKVIGDFGARAKDNKLKVEELQRGTFTISNGGVYGSLLSTPIVNPPQSGVLGMHAIQERPVARDGNVVIRPMMYVALTYDHRIVDGRDAVTFLKRIKDTIENPARMLLEI